MCRHALGFYFHALANLCFSVALYIYIIALLLAFVLKKVIGKILIDFCVGPLTRVVYSF